MKNFNATITSLILSCSSCLAVVTDAKVVVVNGSVTSKAPVAGESIPVVKGADVHVGSTIQTGQKSDLLMTPLPGAAVRILENNTVVLSEADLQKNGETVLGRKARLQLNRGTVQVGIDKVGGSTDFKITTPQCVAAARGTVFSTTCVKGSTTTVVLNGVVAVPWTDGKGKSHSVDVKPGMKVSIKEGPGGLEQDGPKSATPSELGALGDFVTLAAGWRILSPAPFSPFAPFASGGKSVLSAAGVPTASLTTASSTAPALLAAPELPPVSP